MSRITDTREIILTSDSTGENWSAAAWDPRTGSLLSTYKNASAVGHHTLQLLDNSYLVAADSTKPRLHVWPLNSQYPVPNLRLATPGKVTALTATPNGSYIVVAVGEKLFVWQLCNGRLLANLTRHYQTVTCLTFSKDGSIFASGGEDGLVFVWSLYRATNEEQCAPLHAFSDHSLPVKDLHFSHTGIRGRLCSVSLDRTANIYEPSQGTRLLTLVFDVPLTSVCMNIRESDLFVGCTNGMISQFNLHEPPRGVEHHVRVGGDSDGGVIFRGHKESVVTLSVSVDCRTLLSGSADGAVHIWDIGSRQILRTIEHKGPITAAFFAKRYENLRAANLKARIQIRNLQRTSDESGREALLEVVRPERRSSEILDFESYVDKGDFGKFAEQSSSKNDSTKEEIEKLKKINAALYQYSVKHILGVMEDG